MKYPIKTQISLDIMHIWSRLKINIETMADEYGLTLPQIFLLHKLCSNDSILMGDLAKKMHCDASNVTNLVDRLESRDLIERRDVPGDRRAKQLYITTEGEVLIKDMHTKLHENIGLENLTPDELKIVNTLLQKMAL